jgi:hypothetical protein
VAFLKKIFSLTLAVLIGLFFVLMSRIDFLVHSTLYNYGLVFSYEWANVYWLIYGLVFVAFSLVVAFVYYLGSQKKLANKKVALALFTSINVLSICGLQDVLFYVLWAGSLPPSNMVWWWSLWRLVFGTWNSQMQLTLTASAFGISLLSWAVALYQKKPKLLTH